MKKNMLSLAAAALILLASCSDKKQSASSVAQQWCDLNGKVYRADESSKESAKAALKKFEDDIEAKYKNDKAFMDEVGKEVEKCEDASEGRK